MATPPDFVSGQILTAAQMNAVGMWLNTAPTVTSVGGTSATASNGVITIGAGNTSVTVSNAFSSDYENYRILITGGVATASVNISLQLGASVTGYYDAGAIYAYSTAAQSLVNDNNAASFTRAGAGSVNNLFMDVTLGGPAVAKTTSYSSTYVLHVTTSQAGSLGGFHNVATAYTAFTIAPSSGTLTGGKIFVYGFNDGF